LYLEIDFLDKLYAIIHSVLIYLNNHKSCIALGNNGREILQSACVRASVCVLLHSVWCFHFCQHAVVCKSRNSCKPWG